MTEIPEVLAESVEGFDVWIVLTAYDNPAGWNYYPMAYRSEREAREFASTNRANGDFRAVVRVRVPQWMLRDFREANA